jgi:hypothetical protein
VFQPAPLLTSRRFEFVDIGGSGAIYPTLQHECTTFSSAGVSSTRKMAGHLPWTFARQLSGTGTGHYFEHRSSEYPSIEFHDVFFVTLITTITTTIRNPKN